MEFTAEAGCEIKHIHQNTVEVHVKLRIQMRLSLEQRGGLKLS